MRDVITPLRLGALEAKFPAGGAYLHALTDLIGEAAHAGIARIAPDRVRRAQRRIAAEQVRYLVEHDTPERYYRETFARLGLDLGAQEVDPDRFLDHMVYHARDLVQGKAQRLRRVAAPLAGGRVYLSSGTSNPAARKRIYYDAVTAVLLREVNRLGWEAVTGRAVTAGTRILLMMPVQAQISMPFASLVADMLSASGAHVYWGARFIRPPKTFVDDAFGVATAELDFQDNVRPNKSGIARFNLGCRLGNDGPHAMLGLLPALYAMLSATAGKRGVARFFAHPKPKIIAFGGGLKRMGIPPSVVSRGTGAVEAYLDEVKDVTGIDPRVLGAARSDRPPEMDRALDELFTAFLASRVEALSAARCFNIYAGAEVQPAFFPAGSLRDLYGDGYLRGRDGSPPADIFVPPVGAAMQLRDPVTDEVIPPSQPGRAGVLRIWNPFNVSHLHALETEDMLAWAPIPERATFRPAYAQGVGVRFRGRTPGGSGGGYCAA